MNNMLKNSKKKSKMKKYTYRYIEYRHNVILCGEQQKRDMEIY